MIRTTLKTKHRDTITFDYRYANYMDKPIIRITSSFQSVLLSLATTTYYFILMGLLMVILTTQTQQAITSKLVN